MSNFEDDYAIEAYHAELEREEYENWKDNMRWEIIDDFIEDTTLSYFEYNEDILSISYRAQDEAKKVIDISPSSATLFTYTAIETAIKLAILKPMIYGMTHNEKVADLLVDKFLRQSNVDGYTSISFDLVDKLLNLKLSDVKTTNGKKIIEEIKKLAKMRNGIIHSGELVEKKDALYALGILDDLYEKVIMKMLNHINFTIVNKKIFRQS